jgi:hypothetical protein
MKRRSESYFIFSILFLSNSSEDDDSQMLANTAKTFVSSTYSQQIKKEDCKELLDPSKRPKWGLDRHHRDHEGKY